MRIRHHCHSGHVMKLDKSPMAKIGGDSVFRCTGMVNKRDKRGNALRNADGTKQKIPCRHTRSWSYMEAYKIGYQ